MVNRHFLLNTLLTVLASAFCQIALSQTVPVGMPGIEDYYRRQQLLGKVDSNLSFALRPITPHYAFNEADAFYPNEKLDNEKLDHLKPINFANSKGLFMVLPISWQQQFNSHHPYGWNDGAMIPAKGYQTMVGAGFFVKYGPLSIQFRPEFVFAANSAFSSPLKPNPDLIDDPVRFGDGPYKKANLGQSSIRLTFDPISFGLSNENVWWGPAIGNAIILSNNAPGFKHFTVNTVRPIKTFLGLFEGQVLAGRLDESGYQVDNPARKPRLRREWRYFTGFNVNYHLKWLPGLTLGLTRTFNAYHSDVTSIKEYLPFFSSYQKQDTDGDPIERDQYTSLYARWLFVKENAEVYFEYGVNDHSYNYRDFIMTPEHARAYTFGVRKMFEIKPQSNKYIMVSTEITQLSQNPDRLIRGLQTWYVHGGVRQGHTNLGQVLGAGIGPGSNIQSADVSWVSGIKRIGLGFDRYEVNATYSSQLAPINDNSRNWVDMALRANGEWNYKKMIFNVKLAYIKSYNYQWLLKNYDPSQFYIPNNTVYNFHGQLGVTYIL